MPPFYSDDRVTVHHGDCLDVLRTLPGCSVDSVVTDPPAAISFMNRGWDDDKGGRDAWVAWLAVVLAECRRILKPGGHALVWALPRTSGWTHRAIEDAGLDVRDCITHLFGSGFPKSLDVGKAIDRAAGAEPVVIGPDEYRRARANRGTTSAIQPSYDKPRAAQAEAVVTAPATEDAARWDGWGTALKPSIEMWYLARKPLAGTVAATVLTHGTGALNIAATRVGTSAQDAAAMQRANTPGSGRMKAGGSPIGTFVRSNPTGAMDTTRGRWPSNVVLTHSPSDPEDGCAPGCPVAELDAQSGNRPGARDQRHLSKPGSMFTGCEVGDFQGYNDQGSASRFFPVFRYQAKAPTRERPKVDGVAHETVKPLALMIWLAKLVTPPGGTILDPFGGSGTTAEAALAAGFRCVTIEREERYLPLILARIQRQEPAEAPRPVAEQMSLLDDPAA